MDNPLTDEIYLANVDQDLVQEKRNTNLPIAILAISCIAAGCGIFYYRGMQPHFVRLSSFLLMGFLFAAATQKKTAAETSSFIPVVTAIGIQACIVLFCFVTRRFEMASNLAFFAAFLLPVIVIQAWQQFSSIPQHLPRSWHYSPGLPPQPPFVYSEKRPVRFKIVQPGGNRVLLRSSAAGQIKVGMAFFYAVQEQEDGMKSEVPFTDDNQRPHEWIFYTVSFGRKRYIDPEESLYENQVSARSTIVAECIR